MKMVKPNQNASMVHKGMLECEHVSICYSPVTSSVDGPRYNIYVRKIVRMETK